MKYGLLLSLLLSFSVFGQDKLVKKIEKVLGHELVAIDPDYSLKIDSSQLYDVLSRTQEATIIGQQYKGEYLRRIDSIERNAILYPTYLIENAVTKSEFLEFRTWIRDSIARELIYFGLDGAEIANRYINYEDSHYSNLKKKIIETELYERAYNRQVFSLNWDAKFDYNASDLIPHFFEMYEATPQRFRKKKAFDLRKYYASFQLEGASYKSQVPILIENYTLAVQSKSDFDRRTVLSYLHDQIYGDAPISFIEPFMAEAFCQWKSMELNRELNQENLKAIIRLPNPYEVNTFKRITEGSINIDEYDHTKHWNISNEEFRVFCDAALDSVCREYLYTNEVNDKNALTLIAYQDYFYSPDDGEYIELEPADRKVNRILYSWNRKKVNWKNFGYENRAALVNEMKIDTMQFRYQWMDARNRSVRGKLYPVEPKPAFRNSPRRLDLDNDALDEFGEPIGQDKSLDGYLRYPNSSNATFGFGTRCHANAQRFIQNELISLPLPEAFPENDSIANITYDQALAYYNWKYRIDLYDEGEKGDWQQFVFPTEEEFERIKKGESIIHPAEEIEYDTPVFRIAVELIPKK